MVFGDGRIVEFEMCHNQTRRGSSMSERSQQQTDWAV
jgi:hypothetical protein